MANLIVNPGFETGDLAGWKSDLQSRVGITNDSHSGSFAVLGGQGVSNPGPVIGPARNDLYQNFNISSVSGNYIFSFWFKGVSALGSLGVQLIAIDGVRLLDVNIRLTSTKWTYREYLVTSGYTGDLELVFEFPDSRAIVDDVYFAAQEDNIIVNGSFSNGLAPWVPSPDSKNPEGNGIKLFAGESVSQEIQTTPGFLYESSFIFTGSGADPRESKATVNVRDQTGIGYSTYCDVQVIISGVFHFKFYGTGTMTFTIGVETGVVSFTDVQARIVGTPDRPKSLNGISEGSFQSSTLQSWNPTPSYEFTPPTLILTGGRYTVFLNRGDSITQDVPTIARRMGVLKFAAYATRIPQDLKIYINGQLRKLDGTRKIGTAYNYYYFPMISAGTQANIRFEGTNGNSEFRVALTDISLNYLQDLLYRKNLTLGRYRIRFNATSVPTFGFENPGKIFAYINGVLQPGYNPIVVNNFAVSESEPNFQPYLIDFELTSGTTVLLQFMVDETVVLYKDFTLTRL